MIFDDVVSGNAKYETAAFIEYKRSAPPIRCADGTNLKVQASSLHCCTPRNDLGPYRNLQIDYVDSKPPDSWAEYLYGTWPRDWGVAIYGHIPVHLVREYIELHGGEVPR